MVYPSLDDLLKYVDNKYTLVVVAAKRARQITEDKQSGEERSVKAVTAALEEIYRGKTKYERTKSGIK